MAQWVVVDGTYKLLDWDDPGLEGTFTGYTPDGAPIFESDPFAKKYDPYGQTAGKSWQTNADELLGLQAADVKKVLTQIDPNYNWTEAIRTTRMALDKASPDGGWADPNRGASMAIASQIVTGSGVSQYQQYVPMLNQQGTQQAAAIQDWQSKQGKPWYGDYLKPILAIGGLVAGGAGLAGMLGGEAAAAAAGAGLGDAALGGFYGGLGEGALTAGMAGGAAGGMTLGDASLGALADTGAGYAAGAGAEGALSAAELAANAGVEAGSFVDTAAATGAEAGAGGSTVSDVTDIFDIWSDSGEWNNFIPDATTGGTGGTFGGLEDLAAQYPEQFGDIAAKAAAEGALTPLEQLKYMYDKLPSLPPGTQTAVKALLGQAAKAMGITGVDNPNDSGFLGKIGSWLSNNPGTALLGGGVLAAILADRNKEQKLTTTKTPTPEAQAAINSQLANITANQYTPSTYTGALAAGLDPNQIEAAKRAAYTPEEYAGAVGKMVNPLVQPYLDPQKYNFGIETGQGRNQILANAVARNAFTGGRSDQELALYNEGRDRTWGGIESAIRKGAFDTAANTFNTQIGQLGATGAVNYQVDAANKQKAYEAWLQDEKNKQIAATGLSAGAIGTLAGTGGTTTATGTPPSLISQLAGAGTALYGVNQLLKPTA